MSLQKPLKGFHLTKHLLAMKNNYAKSYYNLFQEYGDIVRLDKPWKMNIISDSELAKKILIDDASKFTISKLADDLVPLMGQGMITSDGEHWISQKRMVSPSFSAKQIQSFSAQIEKLAHSALEAQQGNIDLSKIILSYTYHVIASMIFGNSLEGDLLKLEKAINYCLKFTSKRQAALVKPPLYFYPKFNKHIRFIEEILLESSQSPQPNSLIEKLSESYDINSAEGIRALRDQVITIFITGHETTANTLIWALYYIFSYKLPTLKLLNDDEYLEALLKETMRLYPAAPVSPRNLKEDYQYKDQKFQAGEEFLVSSFNLHRHPSYWKKPNNFNPENFYHRQIDNNFYFPFGRGKRSCIGEHLAMAEMKIFIKTLLSLHVPKVPADFKVCDFDATLTLRPKENLKVTI